MNPTDTGDQPNAANKPNLMKLVLKPDNRRPSQSDFIADLQRVALLYGGKVTQAQYDQSGRFSKRTVTRYMGSWSAGLILAGLEENRTPMNVAVEDLFRNLRDVWMELERQPLISEMQKPLSKYSGTTYENRFGGWRKALEAFVEHSEDAGAKRSALITEPSSHRDIPHRTSRHISRELLWRVLNRDGFTCKACGNSKHKDAAFIWHIDYITPVSRGGLTVSENLQVLCQPCNLLKSNLGSQVDSPIEVQNV